MTAPANIAELASREAIRDALAAYCRAVDRLDVALGHSVFHEDSHADYGAGVYQGPGRGCIDKICQDHLNLTSHSHQLAQVTIALDGDRAGSEAYMTGTMRTVRDGREMQIVVRARYLDRWEKRGGRWAITQRQVAYDHDEIREVASLRGTLNAARDRSDPSYAMLSGAGS